MNIETQIWGVAVVNIVLVAVVCYQAIILGRQPIASIGASFGKIEAFAWVVFLLYRLYGLSQLPSQMDQAKSCGMIPGETLSLSQWISISGNILFIIIMILAKHNERNTIRNAWHSWIQGPETTPGAVGGELNPQKETLNK